MKGVKEKIKAIGENPRIIKEQRKEKRKSANCSNYENRSMISRRGNSVVSSRRGLECSIGDRSSGLSDNDIGTMKAT